MKIAIWIIAICEVIRMIQNFIQIRQIKKANGIEQMDRATDAFIKSVNKTNAEFVEDLFKNMIVDYSRANECKQESCGYTCYKCGKCGRKFENGFMVDDGGTTDSEED